MGRNLFYEKRSSPYPSSKSLDDGGGNMLKSVFVTYFGCRKITLLGINFDK